MTDPVLISSVEEKVVTLTLNRTKQFNALNNALLQALIAQLDKISDDPNISAVILQANGKAFCAGHDLKEMRQNTDKASHQSLFSLCSTLMQRIIALPQPVIAKVQGMATAAGCQLVATCDLAIASEQARFAVSGIRLGLFCSTPAVALSRNIGQKRALEMLLTGEFISAQTALEFGLLNRVVPHEDLHTATCDFADKIVHYPERVIKLGKNIFYKQLGMDITEAYVNTSEVISDNMMLEETIEGIDAFIEKRKPDW